MADETAAPSEGSDASGADGGRGGEPAALEASPPGRSKRRSLESVGLSSESLTQGGGGLANGTEGTDKGAGFRFKGVFRGPMRVGIDNSGTLTPGRLQYHAPPVVPDGNFGEPSTSSSVAAERSVVVPSAQPWSVRRRACGPGSSSPEGP